MAAFTTRNKPEWDELERLIARAKRSVRQLTPEEVTRLDVLYRRTTVHLAQVRSRTNDVTLIRYLNGLTSAAHGLIYVAPRGQVIAGGFTFLVEGFARTIARNWVWHLASLILMIGGALLAAFAGSLDPVALYALLPAGDPRAPGASRELLLEMLRSGRDTESAGKFVFASFLFSHNFKVGLLSMALGILAAVPTVILITYNGMILGAFAAVHHQAGIRGEMWAWILPHGITEIGAIVLCGGVGLQIGWATVCQGPESRNNALKHVAGEAGRTIIGTGLMLVFAAIIESYLRQSNLSTQARLLFAATTGVFWVLYIGHGWILERRVRAIAGIRSESQITTDSSSSAQGNG
jgi:uncharacterized membrane protein SpoIIM required for sporulation